MKSTASNKTLSNFIWRFAERCGAQVVTFVVSIIFSSSFSSRRLRKDCSNYCIHDDYASICG